MKRLLPFAMALVAIGMLLMALPGCNKDKDDKAETVTDKDGNVYNTVTIGTQVWMVENLRTTKLSDGTGIPLVEPENDWKVLDTVGFCWYQNDKPSFGNDYGALYNWYTVATGKLCPTGWRVPTDDDWTTLVQSLGGDAVAGGKLKESGPAYWSNPNTGATNESGFNARAGGYRDSFGNFSNLRTSSHWWSSTEFNTAAAWYRHLQYNNATIANDKWTKNFGLSIRCMKNK